MSGFQPSAHSFGSVSADQITAIAQLTAAGTGAGISVAQAVRRRRRKGRRRRRKPVAAPPPPPMLPPEPEPEPDNKIYWVLGLGAFGALGVYAMRDKLFPKTKIPGK